jgi:DNA-directed RNA polymerase specialized sigma24 family protein
MPVVTPTETRMSLLAQDRFERVIAECYEELKPEVLSTVRGKLAVDSLHPDPSDLEAAYNAAWHALYERHRKHGDGVANLGGWLATVTYRRAIDDVRRAHRKYLAPVAVDESIRDLGYEHDVDAEIADRQRYHQWLMSVRLRLNARERPAVSLCVLHEHSRRDASEIMGIDIKRLDKIMVEATRSSAPSRPPGLPR